MDRLRWYYNNTTQEERINGPAFARASQPIAAKFEELPAGSSNPGLLDVGLRQKISRTLASVEARARLLLSDTSRLQRDTDLKNTEREDLLFGFARNSRLSAEAIEALKALLAEDDRERAASHDGNKETSRRNLDTGPSTDPPRATEDQSGTQRHPSKRQKKSQKDEGH